MLAQSIIQKSPGARQPDWDFRTVKKARARVPQRENEGVPVRLLKPWTFGLSGQPQKRQPKHADRAAIRNGGNGGVGAGPPKCRSLKKKRTWSMDKKKAAGKRPPLVKPTEEPIISAACDEGRRNPRGPSQA
jgi:hypothetical protein